MLIHTTGAQPPLALQYGMFVKAAYDVYNAYPNNLNPLQSAYPDFPSGYQLLFNIQMSDFFGSQLTQKYYGFIARSTANPNAFVTAIRGTQTMEEWWDDFHWGLVPFPYLSNAGNVADGFLDIYKTFSIMAPGSKGAATTLKDKKKLPGGISLSAPNVTLVAVGHSLGAALITLYGLDVAAGGGLNPQVYTFASPRVAIRISRTPTMRRLRPTIAYTTGPIWFQTFPKIHSTTTNKLREPTRSIHWNTLSK